MHFFCFSKITSKTGDLRLRFFYYFSIIFNNNIDLAQNKIVILENNANFFNSYSCIIKIIQTLIILLLF